ncbi:hypothetical protein MtrunA17_Chr4g0003091 [Medicago truncatula]|uniref:VQ motif protein n=1 Tax=Medicago truncatula TaxID=3880 RepID=G7JGW0_MEDTR|nr:VQ motif-containing protein 11 [Medicago truncatula]AES86553.1 VQ motif protein [Medicago truncatula]RHN58499.1 hypothetical protein MtrunA17_Chr4g0003091 [Medicago truncatula]
MHSPTYGSDLTTQPNTTFVQADPSNFRQVVQKLTGASQDPSAQKLPLTLPSRLTAQAQAQAHRPLPTTTMEPPMGLKKPNFKLHERRSKKLQLNVSENPMMFQNNNNNNNMRSVVMASPVSPLEYYYSPKSPHENEEKEEEKVIAEKGFYLHPSPRASQQQPPALLPLFPLHSPSSQSHS